MDIPGWVERELETLTPTLSSCSHTLLLRPPALAQVAPTGSLPHAEAFLWLPGAGPQPHQSPWPQSPRVCNRDRKKKKKPKKRNQDSPTPRVRRGDGTSRSPTDGPSFPMLHWDVPEPQFLSAHSPALHSGTPKEKESSLAGAVPGGSSPPPGPACPGLTESTAGRDPPWSRGPETQCSWRLPGASAAWPSVGKGAWHQAQGG